MGRQAFITRLALGRSALEPVDPPSLQDRSRKPPAQADSESKPSNEDTSDQRGANASVTSDENSIIARSLDYQQQYDAKGYPQNPLSETARRRWRHAINDVLATVGICISKGEKPIQNSDAQDSHLVDGLQAANTLGLLVGDVDALLRLGSERWITSLRQRYQVFKFYADVPLVEIIKSEGKHFGGLQFLFAGVPSALMFWLLDYGFKRVTKYAFQALRDATRSRLETGTCWHKLHEAALDIAETLTGFSLFALIAPLKCYCTLQNLDLLPPITVRPIFVTYKSIFTAFYSSKQKFGRLSSFAFLLLLYVSHLDNQTIAPKIFQYVWAALPKPTRPDELSMVAAQKNGLDIFDIAGPMDENNPPKKRVSTSVVDKLAWDLQELGRNWQIFHDRCAKFLRFAFRSIPSGLESSRPLESVQHDQRSTAHLDMGDFDENHSSTSSPSASPPRILDHGRPTSSSTNSSTLPSLPGSPRPEIYVSFSIPEPSSASPYIPMEGVERRGFFMGSADQHEDNEDNVWLDQDQLFYGPDGLADQLADENLDTQENHSRIEPYYRVTAVSAYPAHKMAIRLTDILSSALYLPIEAFYLRTLAIAFLSSPDKSPLSVQAAARWKREVYPPWPWLASGWHAGGLRGAGNYLGKMILVLGLQAGASYVSWQFGVGAVWWIGRTYKAWTKPSSEGTTQ